jgi:hypothetical protein
MSFANIFFFKLIFVSKNKPNDSNIGCKSPSNLIEFFERDIDLEKSLKSLKGNLKRMKLLKCKSSINKLLVILESIFVTLIITFF